MKETLSHVDTIKADELDLENIIQSISNEIIKSQQRIKDSGGRPIFFIEKAKISISFVVKRIGQGSIKLYVAEAGGSYSSEQTHRIELELSTVPPLLNSLLPHMKPTAEDARELLEQFKQEAGQ